MSRLAPLILATILASPSAQAQQLLGPWHDDTESLRLHQLEDRQARLERQVADQAQHLNNLDKRLKETNLNLNELLIQQLIQKRKAKPNDTTR